MGFWAVHTSPQLYLPPRERARCITLPTSLTEKLCGCHTQPCDTWHRRLRHSQGEGTEADGHVISQSPPATTPQAVHRAQRHTRGTSSLSLGSSVTVLLTREWWAVSQLQNSPGHHRVRSLQGWRWLHPAVAPQAQPLICTL